MMNHEILQMMKKLLENKVKTFKSYTGICYNMENLLILENCDSPYKWINWARNKWVTWEHYSGDINYPVPTCNSHIINPEIMYNETSNKCDKTTEYGKKRIELLKFLIKEAEKELS